MAQSKSFLPNLGRSIAASIDPQTAIPRVSLRQASLAPSERGTFNSNPLLLLDNLKAKLPPNSGEIKCAPYIVHVSRQLTLPPGNRAFSGQIAPNSRASIDVTEITTRSRKLSADTKHQQRSDMSMATVTPSSNDFDTKWNERPAVQGIS
jgi:hypothetical protein